MSGDKPRFRVKGKTPVSIEMEYRHVLVCIRKTYRRLKDIHAALQGVSEFKPKDIAEALEGLLKKWDVPVEKIKSWAELEKILRQHETKRALPEVKKITHARARLGATEDVADVLKKLREAAFAHLTKYCVSLKEYSGALSISAVDTHDDKLQQLEAELKQRLRAAEEAVKKTAVSGQHLVDVIPRTESKEQMVLKALDPLRAVCGPMQSWVEEEKTYPKQLWKEIQEAESRRVAIKKELLELTVQKSEVEYQVERKNFAQAKLSIRLGMFRKEKNRIKESCKQLQLLEKKGQAELIEADQHLAEVDERFTTRRSNSPALYDMLSSQLQTAQKEQRRARDRLQTIHKQQARLDRELKGVSDRTYELDVEHRASDVVLYRHKEKLRSIDDEEKQKRKELVYFDHVIMSVKRIREKKLSADTLRQIFYQKKTEDYHTDPVSVATKLLSAELQGEEWKLLYEQLAFSPARSMGLKHQDVDAISARSHGNTLSQTIEKALFKWRVLNRGGTVRAMIQGLRKIKRVDLAERLKEQMNEPDESPRDLPSNRLPPIAQVSG